MRIRFWDSTDLEGDWSTTTNSFLLNDTSVIQDITYTYDAVGNITRVVDDSGTENAKIADYTYDHTNQRTAVTDSQGTTIYPNKLYTIQGSTTEKHLFAGDMLLATIENDNGATSTFTIHRDHLGGTNAVTDEEGTLAQALDYYPYGAIRNNASTGFDEKNKFTGHQFDEDAGLYYMQARYQEPEWGRFVGQDPAVLQIGIKKKDDLRMLINPQRLNSYSYAGNNPLRNIDPDGKDWFLFDSGRVEFYGTNPYIRRESTDRSLIEGNAKKLQTQHSYRYELFVQKVRPGGEWDYKNITAKTGSFDDRSDGYIFNGQHYWPDEFGNINYGYTGSAVGLNEGTLLVAAGMVQAVVGAKNLDFSWINNYRTYFDNQDDPSLIKLGVSSYQGKVINNLNILQTTYGISYSYSVGNSYTSGSVYDRSKAMKPKGCLNCR